MPRFAKIQAEKEDALLRDSLGQPEQWAIPVTTRIHELCDRPGWECPCCGAPRGRLVGVDEEFTVLVDRGGGKPWRKRSDETMTPGGRETFEEIVAAAEPSRPGVVTALLPVEFTVMDYAVEDYRDEETPVIYRCGYWQTGKTYQNCAWWGRSLLKFGGDTELFWLLAPQLDQSYELFKKLFDGSSGNKPIMPEELLIRRPHRKTERELWAEVIDGTRIEIRHGGSSGRGLEGKKVSRALYDEASGSKDSVVFEITRARTLLTMGQVGISAVPKEDCDWLYEMVVEPYEAALLQAGA